MRHQTQGESGAIIVMRTPLQKRKPPIREVISIKILILYQIFTLFFINRRRMKRDPSRGRFYVPKHNKAQIFYDQF